MTLFAVLSLELCPSLEPLRMDGWLVVTFHFRAYGWMVMGLGRHMGMAADVGEKFNSNMREERITGSLSGQRLFFGTWLRYG